MVRQIVTRKETLFLFSIFPIVYFLYDFSKWAKYQFISFNRKFPVASKNETPNEGSPKNKDKGGGSGSEWI